MDAKLFFMLGKKSAQILKSDMISRNLTFRGGVFLFQNQLNEVRQVTFLMSLNIENEQYLKIQALAIV